MARGEKAPLEALLHKKPHQHKRALFHAMQFLCPPHMVLVGLAGGCYKNSLMRQCHPEHIIEPAVSWPRIRPVSLSARPSIAGPPLTLARLCWLERGEMLCLLRPLLSPGIGVNGASASCPCPMPDTNLPPTRPTNYCSSQWLRELHSLWGEVCHP